MGRLIDADDVIDARGVAELLGPTQRNTVLVYKRRHLAMPWPVIDLGQGRCKLWLRSELVEWEQQRERQAHQ